MIIFEVGFLCFSYFLTGALTENVTYVTKVATTSSTSTKITKTVLTTRQTKQEVVNSVIFSNKTVNSIKVKYPYGRYDSSDYTRIKDSLSKMTMVRKKTGFDINQFEIDPAMDINSRLWQSNNQVKEDLSERTTKEPDDNSSIKIIDENLSENNLPKHDMVENYNKDAKFGLRVKEFAVDRFSNNQDNENYYKDENFQTMHQHQDAGSGNNNHQNMVKYKDARFRNYYSNNDRYDKKDQIHNQIDDRYYDTNGQDNQHLYTFSDRFINNLEKYQKLMEEWNKVIDKEENKSIERGGKDGPKFTGPKKTSKKPSTKTHVSTSKRKSNSTKTTKSKPKKRKRLNLLKITKKESSGEEDESKAGEEFQDILDYVAKYNITTSPTQATPDPGPEPSAQWYKQVYDETAVRRALREDPYMQRIMKIYFMKRNDYNRRIAGGT